MHTRQRVWRQRHWLGTHGPPQSAASSAALERSAVVGALNVLIRSNHHSMITDSDEDDSDGWESVVTFFSTCCKRICFCFRFLVSVSRFGFVSMFGEACIEGSASVEITWDGGESPFIHSISNDTHAYIRSRTTEPLLLPTRVYTTHVESTEKPWSAAFLIVSSPHCKPRNEYIAPPPHFSPSAHAPRKPQTANRKPLSLPTTE